MKTTTQTRQTLDEMASTLATLGKLVADIEPFYVVGADLGRLELANTYLEQAEDVLADVCANVNEAQEDEDA